VLFLGIYTVGTMTKGCTDPAQVSKPSPQNVDAKSLHLADNLLGATQALHHLLAFLPSPDGVIALSEQIVQLLGSVHLFEKLALHLVFGKSGMMVSGRADGEGWGWGRGKAYCTRFSMMALGTISIIVLRVILK
jgi:hypothetical protein